MALLLCQLGPRLPRWACVPAPAVFRRLASDQDEQVAAARRWLASFTPESIPRKNCEVTFSRSSGPGGQNVNKVNSKATLRLSLASKAGFVPSFVLQKVREKSNYLTKNDELVIQSDSSRKQSENIEECYRRLYFAIKDAVDLPGETSPEQKKRVAALQKADKERRLKEKKFHSSKKNSRRDRPNDY